MGLRTAIVVCGCSHCELPSEILVACVISLESLPQAARVE